MGRGYRLTSPAPDPTIQPKTTAKPRRTTQIEQRKIRSTKSVDTTAIHRRRTPTRQPMTIPTSMTRDELLDLSPPICLIHIESLTKHKIHTRKLKKASQTGGGAKGATTHRSPEIQSQKTMRGGRLGREDKIFEKVFEILLFTLLLLVNLFL